MRKRLLGGGRRLGGGRAGFAGETDAAADDQSQAYNVLLHADFPCAVEHCKVTGNTFPLALEVAMNGRLDVLLLCSVFLFGCFVGNTVSDL
ncbi:hypothetical protein D3C80_1965060 [compost metagenome]|jgi:hypothetical protein